MKSRQGVLAALGRFSEPALLILVSLAGSPKHGYAIQDDIEELTGSRPGPGTLYGALARLERLGLIEPIPSDDRRRPYRITEAGATTLRAELDHLSQIATTGTRRLEAAR